jgi:hypothetical protein
VPAVPQLLVLPYAFIIPSVIKPNSGMHKTSARNMMHVTILAPRISRWLLPDFWQICVPRPNAYIIQHFLLHLIILVEFWEKYKLSNFFCLPFLRLHQQICAILSYPISKGYLISDWHFEQWWQSVILETDPNTLLEITASIVKVQADILITREQIWVLAYVKLKKDGAPYCTFCCFQLWFRQCYKARAHRFIYSRTRL